MISNKSPKTYIRPLHTAVRVAGLASALFASGAFALGLGDMKLYSAVNEPLRAEISLLKVGDLDSNQVLIKLASLKDFERANVERDFFLNGMKYEVVLDGRGGGIVKVSSEDVVREPYLNFLLEAKWPSGRLVREYTLLLDLPSFTSTTTQNSTALQVPQTPQAPQPIATAPAPSSAGQNIRATPLPSTSTPAAAPPRPVVRSQPAPQPIFNRGGDSYSVRSGDTLWEIAEQVQPSAQVSVNQTMLALQRENPNAFINGNINRLKSGAVLRVPNQDRVLEIARNQAQLEVARQNQEWRGSDNDVRQLDARAGAAQQAPTGKAADRGTLTLSSADGVGINSDPNGEAKADINALNSRLNDVMQQLGSSQGENEELNQRVQSLLAELDGLKNKLEVRNSQLAQLQVQGLVEEGDLEFADDVAAVTPEVFEADAGQEAGAESIDGESLLFDDGANESMDVVADEFEAEAELAEADIVQAPAPAVLKEKGFFDSLLSPVWLSAIAGVLAVVAGLFYWRRRKQSEDFEFSDEDSVFDDDINVAEASELDAGDDAAFDSGEVAEQPQQGQGRSGLRDSADGIEAEMGDPIAEADIYVAYGRYPQAIELLNRALEVEPGRPELIAKLAEVYTAAGDEDSAAVEMSKLSGGENNEGSGMGALGMGAAVAAGAGLAGAAIAGVASEAADATALSNLDEAPDVVDEFRDTLADDSAMDFSAELGSDDSLDDFGELGLDDFAAADSDADLGDFDADISDIDIDMQGLDMGDLDLDGAADDVLSTETVAADISTDELDLDLDIAGEVGLDGTDVDFSLDDSELPLEAAADEFDLGLDLDLDEGAADIDLTADIDANSLDSDGLNPADLRDAFAEGNELTGANFIPDSDSDILSDLADADSGDSQGMAAGAAVGLGAAATAIGAAVMGNSTEAVDSASDSVSSGLSDLDDMKFGFEDLDLQSELSDFDETLDTGTSATDLGSSELSNELAELDDGLDLGLDLDLDSDDSALDVSADLGSDELDMLDADETATKLDLARAFIEVGDADGARDILDEVIEEGSDSDQKQAKELLERIA